MKKLLDLFPKIVLVGAIYHLVRDIFQIVGVHYEFTQIGHWGHEWCGMACDYVTLPVDVFLIVVSILAIRRERFGVFEISLIAVLVLSLIMWFLP